LSGRPENSLHPPANSSRCTENITLPARKLSSLIGDVKYHAGEVKYLARYLTFLMENRGSQPEAYGFAAGLGRKRRQRLSLPLNSVLTRLKGRHKSRLPLINQRWRRYSQPRQHQPSPQHLARECHQSKKYFLSTQKIDL
jgi:hypothetical protein